MNKNLADGNDELHNHFLSLPSHDNIKGSNLSELTVNGSSKTFNRSNYEILDETKSFLKKVSTPLSKKINRPLITVHSQEWTRLFLSKKHWICILDSPIDQKLVKECQRYPVSEFDRIAKNFYSRNNYENIMKKLDYLISCDYTNRNIKLIDGYHLQLVYVKKLLQQDFNNAIVLVNTAISWIEYAVAAKFKLVENKNGHSLTRKIKKLSNDIDKYSKKDPKKTYLVELYQVSLCLDDLWDTNKQNFEDGRYNVGIGRHSIQHGRVDPRRYNAEIMEKLICLLYALVKFPEIEDVIR